MPPKPCWRAGFAFAGAVRKLQPWAGQLRTFTTARPAGPAKNRLPHPGRLVAGSYLLQEITAQRAG